MYHHFILDLFNIILAFVFFYMSFNLSKQLHFAFLFWFKCLGLILGILSISKVILFTLGINNISALISIPEGVSYSIFIMLALYPPSDKIFLKPILELSKFLKKSVRTLTKWSIFFIIFLGYFITIGLVFLFNHFNIHEKPEEIIHIVVSSIVFGRLIIVIKPFSKILMFGVFLSIINGILMLYSLSYDDMLFNLAGLFKLLSYIILLASILYIRKIYKFNRK